MAKHAEDVDHPLLQEQVDGVSLAFGQCRQMAVTAALEGTVELEMEVDGQGRQGGQKSQQERAREYRAEKGDLTLAAAPVAEGSASFPVAALAGVDILFGCSASFLVSFLSLVCVCS